MSKLSPFGRSNSPDFRFELLPYVAYVYCRAERTEHARALAQCVSKYGLRVVQAALTSGM